MDGEADDFVINVHGDLVPVEEDEYEDDESEVQIDPEDTVLAVVVQRASGELTVQILGAMTTELMTTLHTAMHDLLRVMTEH